jgi:hypothetical protein
MPRQSWTCRRGNTVSAYISKRIEGGIGKAYRIANAKIDFTDPKTRKLRNEDILSNTEMLKIFPKFVKDIIRESYQTDRYPIHKCWMEAILEYFPDEIELPEINIPVKLGDITKTMYRDNYSLIHGKLGFRMAATQRGWITQPILTQYLDTVSEMKRNDDPTMQSWISRATASILRNFISKCTNDNERAVMELWLMAFAFDARMKDGTAIHSWIFSHVSAVAFKEFIDLLYG